MFLLPFSMVPPGKNARQEGITPRIIGQKFPRQERQRLVVIVIKVARTLVGWYFAIPYQQDSGFFQEQYARKILSILGGRVRIGSFHPQNS